MSLYTGRACDPLIAAIAVIKKGKELADDPEFQARVEAGLIEDFSKKVKEEKKVSKEAKISVTIFLIAMVGIVLLGAVSGLVPTLADGSKLPLTTVIEVSESGTDLHTRTVKKLCRVDCSLIIPNA